MQLCHWIGLLAVYKTIRKKSNERRILENENENENEAQPSWLSLVENEGE